MNEIWETMLGKVKKNVTLLLTKGIRDRIVDFLDDLEEKAAETVNQFDDRVVILLRKVLMMEKIKSKPGKDSEPLE